SSLATTAPPAPEPTTTTSHCSTRSRSMPVTTSSLGSGPSIAPALPSPNAASFSQRSRGNAPLRVAGPTLVPHGVSASVMALLLGLGLRERLDAFVPVADRGLDVVLRNVGSEDDRLQIRHGEAANCRHLAGCQFL